MPCVTPSVHGGGDHRSSIFALLASFLASNGAGCYGTSPCNPLALSGLNLRYMEKNERDLGISYTDNFLTNIPFLKEKISKGAIALLSSVPKAANTQSYLINAVDDKGFYGVDSRGKDAFISFKESLSGRLLSIKK